MTKTLPEGKHSLNEICNKLRHETLEPAKKESEALIAQAHVKADSILRQAEAHADKIIAEARTKADKERYVFQTNLEQAAKQTLETLRQKIEHDLFQPHVAEVVEKGSSDPKLLASLVEKVGLAIEKEGLDTELQLVLPKVLSADEFAKNLSKGMLEKLGEKGITIGDFAGGIQIRLVNKKMMLDLTADTLTHLLLQYVRKDFRDLFFKKQNETR